MVDGHPPQAIAQCRGGELIIEDLASFKRKAEPEKREGKKR